jgi:hypothetical protein
MIEDEKWEVTRATWSVHDHEPILYSVDGQTVFVLYGDDGAPRAQVRSIIADIKDCEIRQLIFNPNKMSTEQAMEKFKERYK